MATAKSFDASLHTGFDRLRPIADIDVFEVTAGQPTYAEIHNHGRNDRLRAYQYSK